MLGAVASDCSFWRANERNTKLFDCTDHDALLQDFANPCSYLQQTDGQDGSNGYKDLFESCFLDFELTNAAVVHK